LDELGKELAGWLSNAKKVVILGVGSQLRSDDALGLEVIRRLEGKIRDHVRLLEGGTVPENYTQVIREFGPTHILMIDAAQLNQEPGYTRLISANKIFGIPTSTHSIPLNMLAEYLKKSTNAKIALLGIQPKSLQFGEELSQEVKAAVATVSETLIEVLTNSPQ
jgi:hydrogenase 3 maturation protease